MTVAAPRVQRDRRYSSQAWRAARDATLARDGFACQACGRQGRQGDRWLVADHRTPPHRYAGAFADLANLWTLCRGCNYSKGDRTVEEWRGRTDAKPAWTSPYARGKPGPELVLPWTRPAPEPTGRPSISDSRRFIAWAMDLHGVSEAPDHDHGRWAPTVTVGAAGRTFHVCPPGCNRPVRWELPR